MEPWVQDASDPASTSLAARHGRNALFGDPNCYTCHADYGMYGTVHTKIGGLRHVAAYYADGYLDMARPYGYRGQEMRTYQQQKETKHDLSAVNHFAAQMDHFSQCILDNTDPLTPGEEGLRDHKVMAAIEEAARSGRRVKV